MKGNVNYLELANSPLMWVSAAILIFSCSIPISFSVRTVLQKVAQSSKRDWN